MNSPSSFEIGRAVGNAVARGYQSYKDKSAIDEILERANASGKPEEVDYAMTQILSRVSPEKQQLALAILQKKKADIQAKQEKNQQKAAYRAQGIPEEIADLPEDAQKDWFKRNYEQFKQREKEKAYEAMNQPRAMASLDPAAQREWMRQKSNSDYLSRMGMPQQGQGGQSSVGVPAQAGQPMPIVDENMDVAAQLEQERPQGVPLNMGEMLNQVSPVQQQAQPMQRPMQGAAQPQMQGQKTNPRSFRDLSDDELVVLSGLPTPEGKAAKVELERRQEQAKIDAQKQIANESSIDKSYEMQKDFIDKTTQQYMGFETEMKPRLLQMQNMDPKEIVGPTAAKFLEAMGIPLGALENPSSELYNKLSQDLLKGLPDTYGNRILKVEVDNFLKTIPTLLNSPNGRRMIASNMLKLGQMKEVFYKEMRRMQSEYLDSNKKFPKDFQQRIFDNIKPQIDKLNNQFVQLSSVKAVPEKTIPFFNPQGQVSFVPNDPNAIKWAEQNGGERIW